MANLSRGRQARCHSKLAVGNLNAKSIKGEEPQVKTRYPRFTLIAEFQATFDKIEKNVEVEKGKGRNGITFSTWSPVIQSKGLWMIYDYRAGFH
jgi:hypothetical protein